LETAIDSARITVIIADATRCFEGAGLVRRGVLANGGWLAAAAAAGVVSCALPGAALAGRWDFTPSVTVSETYTDNVGLAGGSARTPSSAAPGGGESKSDFITAVTPAISVRGSGTRLVLNADYSLSRRMYLHQTDRNEFRHALTGKGVAELWERVFFFDADATISDQLTESRALRSESPANVTENRTRTTSVQAGPRFLHHFGTFANTESKITYGKVFTNTGDQASAVNLNSVGTASDSTTLTESFVMSSGRDFTRVLWAFSTEDSKTSYEGTRPSSRSRNARADLTFVLNRHISLLGGIGWERIEDDTLDEQPSGLIWNAGTRLTPGRRTSFQINYNERFDSNFVSFEGTYIITSRTQLSVSYSESIETPQQRLQRDLSFIGVDEFGQIIDTRTGLPFDPTSSPFGLQEGTSRVKNYRANLTGSRGRNGFGLSIYQSERETDATDETESTIGGNLSWSRTLTTRTSGSVGLNYYSIEYQPEDRTDDNISANVGLTYHLSPDADLSFIVYYTRRDSTDQGFDSTERSATVSLRKVF